MPLAPQQQISHYCLQSKIGQGGMGEVWQAHDGRLNREVAVKFLPPAVSDDPARLERFSREARLLASLNHPGIAAIHDVDQHEGMPFLVMELVPGEDLAAVLDRGPLPVAEALDVGIQILRALEAAHGQGVVHRDLKPANVLRTPDGRIKVLDFGLAKAVDGEASGSSVEVSSSPTVTSAGTMAGMILGTAAYMSPEQARGRPVDKRSDIWSFGVLLYELLTGANPFRGDTVADSVGAIMHRQVDLDALPAGTPHAIRRLLQRCLTRDRAQRLHDAADVRLEIEDALAHPEASLPGTAPDRAPSRLPWLALAVLLPLAVAVSWWLFTPSAPEAAGPVRKFKFAGDVSLNQAIISPAGTHVAYGVYEEQRLFIRALDTLQPREVSNPKEAPGRWFWSPDGRSLGFATFSGDIYRFDLDGHEPVQLASLAEPLGQGVHWADDGHIYFQSFLEGIRRIPAAGGAAETYVKSSDEVTDYHGFKVLAENRGILGVPHARGNQADQIMLERPGEEPRIVYQNDVGMALIDYDPAGYILFEREENPQGLWALPFSESSLEASGDPFLIEPHLRDASVSRSGDMVYTMRSLAAGDTEQYMAWYNRDGTLIRRLEVPLYDARGFAISPDESQVAVVARGVGRPGSDLHSLWVIDLSTAAATRISESRVSGSSPIWSQDGSRVAFTRDPLRGGGKPAAVALRPDGSGDEELLFEADIAFFLNFDPNWSRAVWVSRQSGDAGGLGLYTLGMGGQEQPALFVNGPDQEVMPRIHPSGKWIVYSSGDFVSMDLIIRPFPEGKGQWKVGGTSQAAGSMPMWSHDGKSLYFVRRQDSEEILMEVAFDGSGENPVLGSPVELFRLPDASGFSAVTRSGEFVYITEEEPEDEEAALDLNGLILVENWRSRFPGR